MCMVRLKLHLINLLSTYYTNKFAKKQIEPMELERYCIALMAPTVV